MRVTDIENLIQDTIVDMGFELWGTEYLPQGKHSVLRVFIDSENGINVDDCADVSRQISAILDVEDPIKSEYLLEVSSPGMDRPLFKPDQYRHFCGDNIKVWLKQPVDNSRKFKGELVSIEANQFQLKSDDDTHLISFDNVQKAQVVPEF